MDTGNLIAGLLIIMVVTLAALYQRSLGQPQPPGDNEDRAPLWW